MTGWRGLLAGRRATSGSETGCEVDHSHDDGPFCEVSHSGFSLGVSGLALGTFFGALDCIPASRGTAWAVAVIVLYPVATGLFYIVYRRMGRRLGAPPRLGNAGLGLVFLAWLFLVSGDAVAQELTFPIAAAAVLSCGVSLGGGLAAIATARRSGFREALHSVCRLGREAKRQSWLAATGAAKGGQR